MLMNIEQSKSVSLFKVLSVGRKRPLRENCVQRVLLIQGQTPPWSFPTSECPELSCPLAAYSMVSSKLNTSVNTTICCVISAYSLERYLFIYLFLKQAVTVNEKYLNAVKVH